MQRFQFNGGFLVQRKEGSELCNINFINSVMGRGLIYHKIDHILNLLANLKIADLANGVAVTTKIPTPWQKLIDELNETTQGLMVSAKLHFNQQTVLAVFTLPAFQKGPGQRELDLIDNLRQQTEALIENNELKVVSLTDELTNLYNKRYFNISIEDEIKKSLLEAKPLSMILIDVDHFKDINDSYGHLVGDIVLKEVGEVIRRSSRVTDISFRYGGEEFVMLLPNTNIENAQVAAERVRKNMERIDFSRFNLDIKVTVSLGLSDCPDDATDSEQLIRTADLALYAAKSAGRNNFKAFNSSMKMPKVAASAK